MASILVINPDSTSIRLTLRVGSTIGMIHPDSFRGKRCAIRFLLIVRGHEAGHGALSVTGTIIRWKRVRQDADHSLRDGDAPRPSGHSSPVTNDQ